MYKAVVFDLDGTLMDTAPGVLQAVRYTVQAMGMPALDTDTILKFIGPPVRQSFIDFCGLSQEQAVQATKIFRDRYSTVDLYGAIVYDGIFDVLGRLQSKKIKIGVATYKREDYAVKLLQKKKSVSVHWASKGTTRRYWWAIRSTTARARQKRAPALLP